MKLVLLDYCFDDLGLYRVECQGDALNTRSQRSLERLGFRYEGVLPGRHRRPDGTRRDSMFYGLIAPDWPAVRANLERLIEHRRPREGHAARPPADRSSKGDAGHQGRSRLGRG